MYPGQRNSITDVNGFLVGNAHDNSIKTGVTVLVAEQSFCAGVHISGGAPGTRETDLLSPDRLVQKADALVLSGGSAFGLDAASGVTEELLRLGRGFKAGEACVPIVPAAILFDLLNRGNKNWDINPYSKLGRLAFHSADKNFSIGSAGAGTGATTLDLKGGLGTASAITSSGYTIGALVAVNALGSVTQHGSDHFWAGAYEFNSEFGGLGLSSKYLPEWEPLITHEKDNVGTNTTIGIIATDADLTQAQITRLAIAAHDGYSRAIFPSHTIFDGDLIFTASSGQVKIKNPELVLFELGHCAAQCMARAIARGIYHASESESDPLPTWQQRYAKRNG